MSRKIPGRRRLSTAQSRSSGHSDRQAASPGRHAEVALGWRSVRTRRERFLFALEASHALRTGSAHFANVGANKTAPWVLLGPPFDRSLFDEKSLRIEIGVRVLRLLGATLARERHADEQLQWRLW